MLNVLHWLFYLGTIALIFLAVTSCSPAPLPAVTIIDPAIESPLHNTCQSGDLLPDFPKCKFNPQEELTYANPNPDLLDLRANRIGGGASHD